ncbi:MAG: hypothetical protein WCO00_17840 [Rhodospirillaceae bacterium]
MVNYLFKIKKYFQSKLRNMFIELFRSEELIAFGYVEPVELEDNPIVMPSDKWSSINMNFDRNIVIIGAKTISGIAVYKASDINTLYKNEPDSAIKPAIIKNSHIHLSNREARDCYREWINQFFVAGTRTTRDDDEEWGAVNGLNRAEVRIIRDEEAPDDFKNTGPMPNKTEHDRLIDSWRRDLASKSGKN